MNRLLMLALGLMLGCNACHGPIVIHDTSDPTMWADAGDPCATACGYITTDSCTVGGLTDNPACAPQCRNDQASPGPQFPLACILDAGSNRDAMIACGVTCP